MIRIGPAGTDGLGYEKALERVAKLGLTAMEVEFVYGVRMSNEKAVSIGKLAGDLGVKLSVHAPYYINLSSFEKDKISASKKRILDSCERAYYLGAEYVVFHAGFYQKRKEKEVYDLIRKEVKALVKETKKNGWKVKLSPETTGKRSQFGSLDELVDMTGDTGCGICVDFAHLLARDGEIDYTKILDKLRGYSYIHSHFTGIEYTDKGEKRHRRPKIKEIYEFIGELIKRDVDISIIVESPEPIKDSLRIKRAVEKLCNTNYKN